MIAMKSLFESLPSDAPSLQQIVRVQASELMIRDEMLSERDATITRLTRRADLLQEQVNFLVAKRYSARSEKGDPGQLFDEAETTALMTSGTEGVEEPLELELEPETVTVSYTRKAHGGRKPLPEALPRLEIIHELSTEERVCPHDGQVLTVIGDEVSEQLDIIPATIQVLRHIRKKYACACGRCVKTAALPPQPLPKTMASPGLLAHIAVSKYQDALPLYRQEQILTRIGVDLPRATLAHWMIKSGVLTQPPPHQPPAGSALGI